jgi:Tol biopolymer transport system component
MLPPTIAPRFKGSDGEVAPAICRASPDLARVAFWVDRGERRGLYVADTEWAEEIGEAAERVWASDDADLTELAWSGDGAYLAFRLTGDPPRIGVLRLANREFTELPGASLAWAGRGATLLVADPPASRLYLKDLELGIEHRICEITDDGDPAFPPVISVSPDQRRFALVTRRSAEDATHVHLAHHDGRAWQATPVTQVPGVNLRILPFWTADSAACGLYVIDPDQHHTAMIAVPDAEGAGDILYTSDSVDAVITPAVHPDGRLIAFVRAHPRADASSLIENRLVLLDPVEHAVAPITADAEIGGKLRWLDDQTLLVEGGAAIWTVQLRATVEQAAADVPEAAPPPESAPSPERAAYVRMTVENSDPALTFSCEIPADWEQTAMPPIDVDFADPAVMRPLCLFGPTYATIFFTVGTRPLVPGLSPAGALAALAGAQGYTIGDVRPVTLRAGAGAEAEASQRSGNDALRGRMVMLEDGGRLFSIVAMAPAPLWQGARHLLDPIVESFALANPSGPTVAVFEQGGDPLPQ